MCGSGAEIIFAYKLGFKGVKPWAKRFSILPFLFASRLFLRQPDCCEQKLEKQAPGLWIRAHTAVVTPLVATPLRPAFRRGTGTTPAVTYVCGHTFPSRLLLSHPFAYYSAPCPRVYPSLDCTSRR